MNKQFNVFDVAPRKSSGDRFTEIEKLQSDKANALRARAIPPPQNNGTALLRSTRVINHHVTGRLMPTTSTDATRTTRDIKHVAPRNMKTVALRAEEDGATLEEVEPERVQRARGISLVAIGAGGVLVLATAYLVMKAIRK